MIELAWVSMSARRPPEPDRYLIRRVLSVTQGKDGIRTVREQVLAASWDGETFFAPWQPDEWRSLPLDMR